jgi:dCTP diphosphatase
MPAEPWAELTHRLRAFALERDWDRFHSPKNLAMALTGEAGELAAEFQWLTEAESQNLDPERMARVKQETADVLLYLVRIADKLQFDLVDAAHRKIDMNAERYPAGQVRGSSRKYNQY